MKRFIVLAVGLLLLIPALPTLAQFGQFTQGPAAGGGGGIAFDSASNGVNNGGTGNISTAISVPTLTNGLFVMCIVGTLTASSDSLPVATLGGTSVVKDITQRYNVAGPRWLYHFHQLAPAAGGSQTLAVTQTGGDFLIAAWAFYSNVGQTGQPDASVVGDSGGTASTVTTNITIANASSWATTCSQSAHGGTGVNGSNTTNRAFDASFSNLQVNDSNTALGTGTFAANMQISTSDLIAQTVVSFHP